MQFFSKHEISDQNENENERKGRGKIELKRIVISTFGSLGDIHPKIALGLELRKRGHQIRKARF
jgi:hypothetical protein